MRRSSTLLAGGLMLACLHAAAGAAAAQPLLGDGAWSWFGDPRAVTHTGAHTRTYVGWVDQQGDIEVSSYDHATRERVTAVLHPRLQQDDHANPSLQVRPDGRLVVYYSRHNGPAMHYRVSSRPEDVRSWETPRTIPTNTPGPFGYTYPNPMRLADESATYLFWRGGNYNPTYSVQRDGEEAWSPARNLLLVPGERPYTKYHSNGRDTIHVAFTNAHPGEYPDVNVYYARIRGDRIERADGAQAGTLGGAPIAPGDADLVYDGTEPAWVHDVAEDDAGRPVIVLASFPSRDDHRYRYARWTGDRWDVREITPAGGSFRGDGGSPYYSGGITLDHEDPSRVYLSRQVGANWEVETWTTPDGGASWTSQPITAGSGEKNVRPVSPRGHVPFGGDLSVIWMRGAYDSWVSYHTSIATWLGEEGNAPPLAEVAPSTREGQAPVAIGFDGSASRDPDGSVTDWSWRFGDGATASGPRVTHTYGSGGRFFPTLTVTDDDGARHTLVEEVVIADPAAPAVYTGAASNGTAHGAIDPENQATTWTVEYGPTAKYGLSTPARALPAADRLDQVRQNLPRLAAGRLYHYRIVATNATGTATGEDRVFVADPPRGSDAYRDEILSTPGLEAYWRLGEAAGASGREERSGAAGQFEGRYVLGQVGALGALGDTAVWFDGVDGAFAGGGTGPAVAATATLEGWFRWSSGVATLRDHTGSGGWLLAFEVDGRLAYRLGGRGVVTDVPIGRVRDGRWHHLVATKDGTSHAMYVDGIVRHSSATGAGAAVAVGPWHVMRNGTRAAFSRGEADEIAIYDRALSATEVRRHHALALALAAAAPVSE